MPKNATPAVAKAIAAKNKAAVAKVTAKAANPAKAAVPKNAPPAVKKAIAAAGGAKAATPAKAAAEQVKQVAKDAKKDQNAKKECDKALATQKTTLTTDLKQQVLSAIQNAVKKFKAAQTTQA